MELLDFKIYKDLYSFPQDVWPVAGPSPSKSIQPDQFWQPKLVPLINFGPPCENVNSKQFKVAN